MVDMVKKDYIPAISKIQRCLCDTLIAKTTVSDDIPCQAEKVKLNRVAALADRIFETNNSLDNALKSVPAGDVLEKATYYRKTICPLMEELRTLVDEIEAESDREFWPVPSYGDLIFSIK